MKEEKKVNTTEEVKPEESGVKLDDKQLEGVTGGVEYVVDLPKVGIPINYEGMSFSIRLPKYPTE